MPKVVRTTEALAAETAVIAESGGVVHWNHVKTGALVIAILSLYFSELLVLIGGGAFIGSITADIGGASMASWPSLAIIIFTAALAAPLSQAADYWGRKWFLVIPNIGGVIGAIISSRATSMGMFIGGFCVGGIGFGSQGLFLAVISEVLPRKYRSWAQAAANAANALGSIFALSLGGYLVSRQDGWRIYLYICAGIYAVAVLLVTLLYNPAPRDLQISLTSYQKFRALDWPEYFLLAGGTVLLCLGLSWAQNPYPWKDAHVLAPVIVGGILLIMLAAYARKYKNGLFHHDLFRDRNYPISLVASGTEGMAYMAAAVFFPFELSVVQAGQMDAYTQALCYMTGFCGFAVSVFVAGFVIYKTKTVRVTGVLTFVLFLGFMISMATVNASTGGANFYGYILFFGVGLGLGLVTIFTSAQFATPPHLIATASGLVSSCRSLGGSVGLAIFNAISNSGFSKNAVPKVTEAVTAFGFPEENIGALIGGLSAGNMTAVQSIPGVTSDIIGAAGLALTDAHVIGFRDVFICGAAFMLMGIIITLFLHNPTQEFNEKIDAPLDILPDENELESKAVVVDQVENERTLE